MKKYILLFLICFSIKLLAVQTNVVDNLLLRNNFQFTGGSIGLNKVLGSSASGFYTPQFITALNSTLVTNITSTTLTVTGQGTSIFTLETPIVNSQTVTNIVGDAIFPFTGQGTKVFTLVPNYNINVTNGFNPTFSGLTVSGNTILGLNGSSTVSFVAPTWTAANGFNLNSGMISGGASGALTNTTGTVLTGLNTITATGALTNFGGTVVSNITVRNTITSSGVQPTWDLGVFTNVTIIANGIASSMGAGYATNVLADFPSIAATGAADLSFSVATFITTGMVATVSHPSSENVGLNVFGISSNGFVILRAQNITALAIDQGSLPYKIQINNLPK